MERSKYFNQTKPTEVQLNYTESSRSSAILRRKRSISQFGAASGFIVTVNGADQTKIDVGPGEGYSGGYYLSNNFRGDNSGERISTYGDSESGSGALSYTVIGQGLASDILNVKNYVSLIYAEVESTALAERNYPFTSHDTIVTDSFTVSVLTEADWNLLTAVELNNRILIAIVTAKGGAALTDADIDQLAQPKNHPVSTQPSTVTGCTLESLAQTTPIGTATLRYVAATHMLYWTAPGDTEGAGVAVPSSGLYTVYSNNTAYWVKIAVVYSSLPVANSSDSITISSLYGREIPIASARDIAHRDMIGSGQPTEANVHGLTLDDIEGGTFTHAQLYHRSGISFGAATTQLACTMDLINERVLINNIGGFVNNFLVDGNTYETITGYTAGTDGEVNFNIAPVPTDGSYLIYLNSAGEPESVYSGGAPWTANINISDIQNTTTGDCVLTWDGLAQTLTWQAQGDGAPGTAVAVVTNATNAYYKLYSSNTANWVIVHVTGALGPSTHSHFTINMNSTDQPYDGILKLRMVNWASGGGGILTDVEDLRQFTTADDMLALYEEHDLDGKHSKVIPNTLTVVVAGNTAAKFKAVGVIGASGSASETGLFGIASTAGVVGWASAIGVYGLATNSAVYGSATSVLAGVFLAPATGVSVSVAGATGIYASASNLAVTVQATRSAVYASVASAVAVRGYASSSCFVAEALGNTGIIGYAGTKVAIYGQAYSSTGVWGLSPETGVYGEANHNGVYGKATTSWGVVGSASEIGVFGIASTVAVSGTAAENYGAVGRAGVDYGAFGEAARNYGVYGGAAALYGVYGKASEYGVYGSATASFGVYGKAPNTGVMGTASLGVAAAVVGVVGQAENPSFPNLAYGVYGVASGASAIGVFGYAAHATDGTGVVGAAGSSGFGVYGTGGVDGVFGKGGAIGVAGWGTAAGATGINGIGATGVRGTGTYGGFFGGTSFGIVVSNTIAYSCVVRINSITVKSEWVPISTTDGERYIQLWEHEPP